MRQVAIVVEGQTEEAMVELVVRPRLWPLNTDVTPIVVETSRAASGQKFKGGGAWRHYVRDIHRLLGQSHWSLVSTMIDFYGYPTDGPGADCSRPHDPRACASEREEAMSAAVADHRFRPFVMLHEFETLVIACAIDRASILGSESIAAVLRAEAAEVNFDVELLNDSTTTAPSKRIARVWPAYEKVTDGVEAIREAGLEHVRSHCPRLSRWVDELSGLQSGQVAE